MSLSGRVNLQASAERNRRFARLTYLFLEDSHDAICKAQDALAGGDLGPARDLGHRLKGAGGTFGFPHLSDLGPCLYRFVETGHDDAAAEILGRIALLLGRRLVDARLQYSDWPEPVSLPGDSGGAP